MKTLLFSLFFLFSLSLFAQNYDDGQGIYHVGSVTNDTIIKLSNNGYTTASEGFIYIDYTDLTAVDGTLKIGSIINLYGYEKFVSYTDEITLSNSTSQVTVNGKSIYLFEAVDGDTTWQIPIMFTMFPGDIPALKYKKTSADSGSLKWRYKARLKK